MADWSLDENVLEAIPEIHPCLQGWPSQSFLNYDYQLVSVSDVEFAFLQACEGNSLAKKTVGDILGNLNFDLNGVRSLQARQLLVLAP
jgi:hypothetical protein